MPFSPSMCFFTAWLPSPHGALPAHGRGTLLQDTTQWQVLHTVHRERWGFWSGQGRSRYTLLFYWTSLSHHSLSAFQKHREVWGLLQLVLWRKLKQGDKNIGGEPLGVFVVWFCFVFFSGWDTSYLSWIRYISAGHLTLTTYTENLPDL